MNWPEVGTDSSVEPKEGTVKIRIIETIILAYPTPRLKVIDSL